VALAEAREVFVAFEMWQALVREELLTYKAGMAYPQIDVNASEVILDRTRKFSESLLDDDTNLWLAKVDGQPAGFLLAYNYERPFGWPKTYVHVAEMYVIPEFRRCLAVARGLEAAVEKWAKELRVDVIECAAVATESQVKRWTKKGFTPYEVLMYRQARWRNNA